MLSTPGSDRRVRTALLVLGTGSLAVGLLQVIDPAGFVRDIGPFGAPNGHYVRDLATWAAAFGVIQLVAAGRPSWQPAVIALGLLQTGLHLINHVVDAHAADPVATGIANAVALVAVLAVYGWLWAIVTREGVPA